VQPDQTLDIDRLAAEAGAQVEFREVLLVGGDGEVRLGTPFVEGARVVAEVLDQGRGKKILVFKYKNKTRYRRRHGRT
jgi:large subunit ribosomal protein L21